MKNKKATASVPMMLGIIVCTILVIIIGIFFFKSVLSSSGERDFSCNELALMAMTTDSSSGNIDFVYSTSTTHFTEKCIDTINNGFGTSFVTFDLEDMESRYPEGKQIAFSLDTLDKEESISTVVIR